MSEMDVQEGDFVEVTVRGTVALALTNAITSHAGFMTSVNYLNSEGKVVNLTIGPGPMADVTVLEPPRKYTVESLDALPVGTILRAEKRGTFLFCEKGMRGVWVTVSGPQDELDDPFNSSEELINYYTDDELTIYVKEDD